MATQGQISYFLACVFIGFCGGLLWQLFSLVKLPFGKLKVKKVLSHVVDGLFFLLFGVVCALLSARLGFPSPRAYMYFAYVLGFIIYLKSVKISLDFFKRICYNTITKLKVKAKKFPKKDKEHI